MQMIVVTRREKAAHEAVFFFEHLRASRYLAEREIPRLCYVALRPALVEISHQQPAGAEILHLRFSKKIGEERFHILFVCRRAEYIYDVIESLFRFLFLCSIRKWCIFLRSHTIKSNIGAIRGQENSECRREEAEEVAQYPLRGALCPNHIGAHLLRKIEGVNEVLAHRAYHGREAEHDRKLEVKIE